MAMQICTPIRMSRHKLGRKKQIDFKETCQLQKPSSIQREELFYLFYQYVILTICHIFVVISLQVNEAAAALVEYVKKKGSKDLLLGDDGVKIGLQLAFKKAPKAKNRCIKM
jgi:hypothetical protein